jgi:uncharacterized RDD family membrane protein YckC
MLPCLHGLCGRSDAHPFLKDGNMPLVTCQVCGQIVSATSDCPLCGTNWERWRLEQEEHDRHAEEEAESLRRYLDPRKRSLAFVVDTAIALPLLSILGWDIEHQTALPTLLAVLFWALLNLFFVVRLGATPGKLAVGARIVDAQTHFLSWGKALLRAIPLFVFIGLVIHAAYNSPTGHGHLLEEITPLLLMYLNLIILSSLGTQGRRAITDYLSGSHVITKESYQELSKGNASEKKPEGKLAL